MKHNIEFSLDLLSFHKYNRDNEGKEMPKTYTLRIIEFGTPPKYRSLLYLRLGIDKTMGVVLFIEFFKFSNVFILRKGKLDSNMNEYDDETSVSDKPTQEKPRYTGILEGMDWINWVAANENGEVYAYDEKPQKSYTFLGASLNRWISFSCKGEKITLAQALLLCGRVPRWSDEEPTSVQVQVIEKRDLGGDDGEYGYPGY